MLMSSGDKVVESRERMGLNQKQFAKLVGVSAGHLSGIETGLRHATREMMQRIADAAHVDVDWLMADEVEQQEEFLRRAFDGIIPVAVYTEEGVRRLRETQGKGEDAKAFVPVAKETAGPLEPQELFAYPRGRNYFVVNPNVRPTTGDLVVAEISGLVAVRRFFQKGDRSELRPGDGEAGETLVFFPAKDDWVYIFGPVVFCGMIPDKKI